MCVRCMLRGDRCNVLDMLLSLSSIPNSFDHEETHHPIAGHPPDVAARSILPAGTRNPATRDERRTKAPSTRPRQGFLLQNPICCYASLPEACSYTSTGIVTCIYNPATTSSFVVPLGVTALTDLSLVGGVGGDGVDKSDIGGYNNHYMGGAATQISIPSFAVPPGVRRPRAPGLLSQLSHKNH